MMSERDPALDQMAVWDPEWVAIYRQIVAPPGPDGALAPRMAALIDVALAVSCTARDREQTRATMRAALDHGATRDELLTVLKMAALLAIHSCSLGAPLLQAAASERGLAMGAVAGPTPASDAMRELGQWNAAWDPFAALDPPWTDRFMAAGIGLYRDEVFSAKDVELLSIAFDASVTHMYAPGTARHINGALDAGATPAEVMAVLKRCVAFGVSALQVGVPILADELMAAGVD
ncbi:MAG: carboxymuconolactone decarboxylase family protein [Thermomicrobiales bacterium]